MARLHDTVTSEKLLILPENRLAYTAVVAWAERKTAGPAVYIYGSSGIGKSHLVRHGVRLLRGARELKLRHVDASEFAAELAAASAARGVRQFQNSYRELDALVVEDLQALEGRLPTQQQLLTLVDELAAHGGRVLWTCRKSPGELIDFLPKLVSRFRGGVPVLMRMPEESSRQSLLEHFAAAHQIPLPPAAAAHLAREMPVSPRELQGLLLQLDQRARRADSIIQVPLIQQVLAAEVRPATIHLGDIARAVARQFGVTLAALRSPVRSQQVMLPRQAAMLLSRELTGAGLEKIGKFYNRNHSTVVHACDRCRERMEADPELRIHLAQVRKLLGTDPQ